MVGAKFCLSLIKNLNILQFFSRKRSEENDGRGSGGSKEKRSRGNRGGEVGKIREGEVSEVVGYEEKGSEGKFGWGNYWN